VFIDERCNSLALFTPYEPGLVYGIALLAREKDP
jgi:hypothetical protein